MKITKLLHHELGLKTVLTPGLMPALVLALLLAGASLLAPARAATPAELLADYSAKAGAPPSPERGRRLFNTKGAGPLEMACADCHGAVPTGTGRHAISEKKIAPLAPAFNPQRFTNAARVEGWFRDNCKDVIGRECTAGEKADLMSWLISLKP